MTASSAAVVISTAKVAIATTEDVDRLLSEQTQVSHGTRRNAMNGQTKAVDIILHEWGRWMRGADDVLGWSKVSVLGKVKIDGVDGAAQATAPTEIPEGVMVTDAAIAKLKDVRQKVVKIAYMHYPNAPRDVQRRKLRMSLCRWNTLLKEVRSFVAAQLGIPPDKE